MAPNSRKRLIRDVSSWLGSTQLFGAGALPLAAMMTRDPGPVLAPLVLAPFGVLMLSVWWAVKKERFGVAAKLAFANALVGAALVAGVLVLLANGAAGASFGLAVTAALALQAVIIAFWLWAAKTLKTAQA